MPHMCKGVAPLLRTHTHTSSASKLSDGRVNDNVLLQTQEPPVDTSFAKSGYLSRSL